MAWVDVDVDDDDDVFDCTAWFVNELMDEPDGFDDVDEDDDEEGWWLPLIWLLSKSTFLLKFIADNELLLFRAAFELFIRDW